MGGYPSQPLVIGIDAGTTRIRVIAFDLSGRIVAAASEPTPINHPQRGWANQDGERTWEAAVRSLRRVTVQLDDPSRVRGLAVASVGEAGVLVDRDGHVKAPMLAWYDKRTEKELRALVDQVGQERLTRITGLAPDPTFSIVKLMWLLRHDPAAEGAIRWLHVADYLAWRLSREAATDMSLASRTMALDIAAGRWSEPLLQAAGISPDLMPPIKSTGHALGAILPAVALATGLPADCVVGVGGHDHVLGALAVGAVRPGVMLDSMGTAEAATLMLDRPRLDPALGAKGYNQGCIDTGDVCAYIFGGMPTSAACVEWFRRLYGGNVSHGRLIDEASEAPIGAEGALFLPHLRIGSPPFPDVSARGAWLGLNADHGRGHLFRAVLEGMALDMANLLAVLRQQLGHQAPERIIAIGGSTQNQLLMAIKAALYQRPIEVAETTEATCLGAAMVGAVASGLFRGLDEARAAMGPEFRAVEPDPSWIEAYRQRLPLFAKAYKTLRSVNGEIHNFKD